MIRLEDLWVEAGSFVLAIENLAIAPGEYLMVLGPTASGKTVLLETVAGLRRCRTGRVWFGDRDVTAEPPERRGVGLVYQDYALFPHLTVAENIAFGLRVRSRGSETRSRAVRKEDRVRRLAGLLGIEALLSRYPEGLSGGERQRVALARAVAVEPEVLLLDEPLSALDAPTRVELQGELRRVQKELGATVLHVTHDLDEALALGDRIAVLIDGELRQVDAPVRVTRFPADVDVARLVGLTNVFPLETLPWFGGAGTLPAEAREPQYAVVRADDIEVEPLEPRSVPAAAGEWSSGALPGGLVPCGALPHELLPHGLGPGFAEADKAVLIGTVKAVQMQSAYVSVRVETAGAEAKLPALILTVHMLRPQVERLGLGTGSPVRISFPVAAVHVCSGGARKARTPGG